MGWVYDAFAQDDIADVLNTIKVKIQSLPPPQAATAKVAISDMQDKDARGVVFWFDGSLALKRPDPSWSWAPYTQKTRHDYISLYEDVKDKLNEASEHEALYAKVDMTNYSDGEATISLWLPQA